MKLKLNCALQECQGSMGCLRSVTRHKARLNWSIAHMQQDYRNELWPLTCSPTCALAVVGKSKENLIENQLPSLMPEVLSQVAAYLEPRELFNLVFLNRKVMETLTIETVMKSAMMTGGHAMTTLEEILVLLNATSIYSPSAVRLLRLINGIRCEICNERCVNHARKGYAIFVCWHCVTKGGMTTMIKCRDLCHNLMGSAMSKLLSNERLASSPHGWYSASAYGINEQTLLSLALSTDTPVKYVTQCQNNQFHRLLVTNNHNMFIWRRPFVDSHGNRCGPIVTYEDTLILKRVCLENPLFFGNDVDGRLVEGLVSHYLKEDLKAPMPDSEDYRKYATIYKSLSGEALKRWRLRHSQAITRSAKHRTNKLKNAVKAMECLSELIDDPRIREKLQYKVNSWFFHKQFCGSTPCLVVLDKKARLILSNYLLNPVSMMEKETMEKIVQKICAGI